MTNQIYPQNQRIPGNYSGVTINVTNPSLSSMCPPQQCQQVHQAPYCCPQHSQFAQMSYPSEYYINNYNQPQVIPQAAQQQLPQMQQPVPYMSSQQSVAQQPPQNIQNHQVYYNNNYAMPNSQGGQPVQDLGAYSYPQPPQMQNPYMPAPQGMYPAYDFEQEQNLATSKEVLAKLDKLIEVEQNQQKNKAKKQIVVLTNEYIMSLENFLNNPNKEIRRKGASEVINRFGEDKTRRDDAALNALLNKMLQDPDKGVRTLGLSAVSSGIASGNEFTVQILKNMEANPQLYPDDMEQVAMALLKMSAATETIYVDAPPKK